MQTEFPSVDKIFKVPQPPRLEKPLRIAEQVWPEGTVPVVSIFCITYNHENFVRDAIEGFLFQETTFPVEIYVHDDASTDKTAAIIEEYARRYPPLFNTVLSKQNRFSHEGFAFFFEHLARQRGEFVALCEGDDRWISPFKLEKQVQLLEANPQASGCFHLAHVVDEQGNLRDTYPPPQYRRARTIEDISFNYWLPTCSLAYRADAAPHNFAWAIGLAMGDVPLLAELCSRGPLLFVDETFAIYRQHVGGSWSQRSSEDKIRATIELYDRAEMRFGKRCLWKMRKARKNYYADLFGKLMDRNAYFEALKCLFAYMTVGPGGGKLWKTQKSNLARLFSCGKCCVGSRLLARTRE
jgi:glycosyltransferase involved in cell wall biosynthesis